MTSKEYKLLLVLSAASPVALNGLQLKLAGGYWFMPWQHLFDMVQKGWLATNKGLPDPQGTPRPTYYNLTREGRTALVNEIDRKAHIL